MSVLVSIQVADGGIYVLNLELYVVPDDGVSASLSVHHTKAVIGRPPTSGRG